MSRSSRAERHAILGVVTTSIDLVALDEILAARERTGGRVHRTPLLSSATAARQIAEGGGPRLGDGRLYVKAEHLQKTGSFKPRGMVNRMETLTQDERASGAITMSAGNAGQAYAWAAREAGVPMTVVMPTDANPTKVEACRGYGAEVVLEGENVGDAYRALVRVRDERGLTFVHPFNDRAVIAGDGTTGLEILDDLPEVDVVVVGIGGGGLISGIATAIKEQRPATRVHGVEPELADAMTRAFEAGKPVEIQPHSVADGLGAPFAGDLTLAICRHYLDGIALIDDPTILGGLRFALERMKQVIEPAAAAPLAAVMSGRIPIADGERVCIVTSGGNVNIGRLGEYLAAASPLIYGRVERSA